MLIDALHQHLFEDSCLFAMLLNFSLKYHSIVFLGYYDEGPIIVIAICSTYGNLWGHSYSYIPALWGLLTLWGHKLRNSINFAKRMQFPL